jgi:hypothetical protein
VPVTYGMLAQFADADALIAAAKATHAAGYRAAEAYSPYPLPEAVHALGRKRSGVPLVMLLGGLVGGTGGFFLAWWISVVDYPFNVGGRPLNSWPLFIPVTFEMTILTSALVGLLGMLLLNGLPRFHHPLFASPLFARATTDGFYLCVEATDPKFDETETREFLASHGATGVEGVSR